MSPELQSAISNAVGIQSFPVVIRGKAGVGKSYAMAALYRGAERQGHWWHYSEFIRKIQACRRDGGILLPGSMYEVTEENVWRIFVEDSPIVFLDDLGIREPTDSAYEIFYEFLNRRETKPAFYSTNLTWKEIAKIYGSRIHSRILRGSLIEMHGDDKRFVSTRLVKVQG